MKKNELFDVQAIPHPGVVLKAELRERHITQKRLAERMGVQASHLSEVVKGRRGLSAALAEKLAQELEIPAVFWLKMQADYEHKVKSAQLRNTIEREAELALAEYDAAFDLRVLFRRTQMAEVAPSERLAFCKDTLRFGTPAVEARRMAGFFRRSEKTGLDMRMLGTWAVLAEYEAGRVARPQGKFCAERMDELAGRLSRVFHENENTLNRVARLLSDYGIRFCVVPKVEHASVDGFSCVVAGAPAIVITRRFDRIDNVAFAVLHEVGHLKLHLLRAGVARINLARGDGDALPREEAEADAFAAAALISNEEWVAAPECRPVPAEIQRAYTRWARSHGLNKWIVLGRVSHETGIYAFKSDDGRTVG